MTTRQRNHIRMTRAGLKLYKTDASQRLMAKTRRDDLRRATLCINGPLHGKATHGCRCYACYLAHKETA